MTTINDCLGTVDDLSYDVAATAAACNTTPVAVVVAWRDGSLKATCQFEHVATVRFTRRAMLDWLGATVAVTPGGAA